MHVGLVVVCGFTLFVCVRVRFLCFRSHTHTHTAALLSNCRFRCIRLVLQNALELSAPASPLLLLQQPHHDAHPQPTSPPCGWLQLAGHPERFVQFNRPIYPVVTVCRPPIATRRLINGHVQIRSARPISECPHRTETVSIIRTPMNTSTNEPKTKNQST